jgi:F-type H+-transporting ATPase subunit b
MTSIDLSSINLSLIGTAHAAGPATTGHTESHAKGGFPPFQSETYASQLVSFAIIFALLYLIVSKIALPRVGSVLAERQGAIDGDIAEAQRLKNESDAALKAYETDLAEARAKAQAIGTEIRDKLNAQAEAERKTLEDSLAAKLASAEQTIATTRQSAMGNVRGIAAEAASAIVQRLTGLVPDATAVNAAVDTSIKG